MDWLSNKWIPKDLRSIGHQIPLKYQALFQIDNIEISEHNLNIPIRKAGFSELIGKRLFGIQKINECEDCKNYYHGHEHYYDVNCYNGCPTCQQIFEDLKTLDLSEHDTIEKILNEFIQIDFWTEKDIKEFKKDSIINLAKDMVEYNNDLNMQAHSIELFIESYMMDYSYIRDLHPRLWLFVGDDVLTFKTYLLFNSSWGHPHMDDWNLVEWNISQPPATSNIKLIGSNIESIKLYDNDYSIYQDCYSADMDKWIKHSGKDNDYNTPKTKLYPMIRIDTRIKKIGLGAKWFACHYPRSIWQLI